jgi:uncharacterized protein YbaR (Trm112 family)
MFIELIDLFRCPVDHEDSWLVAAFTKMNGRFVVEGKLGCHVCSATYPVVDGVAIFADAEGETATGSAAADDVIRTAALLGLTQPGSLVVLEREAASLAQGIAQMTECRIIAINAPIDVEESERVGLIAADARFPIARGSVDGLVLTSDEAGFAEAGRVLRPGGRVIAPASVTIGGEFREIARDERSVVAELVGPLVTLTGKSTRR